MECCLWLLFEVFWVYFVGVLLLLWWGFFCLFVFFVYGGLSPPPPLLFIYLFNMLYFSNSTPFLHSYKIKTSECNRLGIFAMFQIGFAFFFFCKSDLPILLAKYQSPNARSWTLAVNFLSSSATLCCCLCNLQYWE